LSSVFFDSPVDCAKTCVPALPTGSIRVAAANPAKLTAAFSTVRLLLTKEHIGISLLPARAAAASAAQNFSLK
jgi:hypothetical protein